jgi:hypothetical protein
MFTLHPSPNEMARSLRVAVVVFVVIIVIFFAVAFVFLFVLAWLCRRRTSAATGRSEGSESGPSGCILLMSNRTPRTPWQTQAFAMLRREELLEREPGALLHSAAKPTKTHYLPLD